MIRSNHPVKVTLNLFENRHLRLFLITIFFLAYSPVYAESDYLKLIPVFWSQLYPNGGETLYCGVDFAARDGRVNIEHVFPMSWVTKALGCGTRQQCRDKSAQFNRIESDMHNLFPALKVINQARGAMAYAEVRGEAHVVPGCDLEIDDRARKVDPRPAVRGDIARAMLYMADRYHLTLYKRQKKLLLEWHKKDGPDPEERRRNNLIRQIQGNANPYIQMPPLADRLAN